jgi:Protein of unknown function (DUF4242)
VQSYLVELYLPRSRAHEAQEAAASARVAAEEGTIVRYVRTTYLPDDETCFLVFEGPSSEAVAEVCARAGLGRIRVVCAIEEPKARSRT